MRDTPSVIECQKDETRSQAAERIRVSLFGPSRNAAMAPDPPSEKWHAVSAAARRVCNKFGPEAFAAVPDSDLCLAFLAFGNVKTRLDHAKTARHLILPAEFRVEQP